MKKLLTTLAALLVAGAVQAEPRVQIPAPKGRPVYSRDLVSVASAKMAAAAFAPDPDSVNKWPSTGGFDSTTNITFSGTDLFTSATTFGTAASAADSITFNETAGCITFEGSAADANEARLCGGALDNDATFTFGNAVVPTIGTAVSALQFTDSTVFFSGTTKLSAGQAYASTNIALGGGAFYPEQTALTPDGPYLATGTTSNSWHLAEDGDKAFDFTNGPCGSSACTDPALIVQSHNQNTSQYISLQHNGTNGIISVGTGDVRTSAGFTSTSGAIYSANANGFSTDPASRMNFGGSGTAPFIQYNTVQTPDAFYIGARDDISNVVLVAEASDSTFDFAHAAKTDPTLFIHSHNQNTTQWISLSHNGTDGLLDVGTGRFSFQDGVLFNSNFVYFNDTNGAGVAQTSGATPGGGWLFTGSGSNSVRFGESADVSAGFDFNNGRCVTSACSDPTFIVFSRNQATTQYLQLSSQNATKMGEIQTSLSQIEVGGSKSNITEASAIAIVRFDAPSNSSWGATVFYTVSDDSGGNFVSRSGNIVVQGVNKAGTATCTINASRNAETNDGSQVADSGGGFTLTYTWTNVATTSHCDLSLNAASSAGANTYDIVYSVVANTTVTGLSVLPQ